MTERPWLAQSIEIPSVGSHFWWAKLPPKQEKPSLTLGAPVWAPLNIEKNGELSRRVSGLERRRKNNYQLGEQGALK